MNIKTGDRIRIHPASDWFMKGEKYATVTRVTRTRIHVQGERSGARFALNMRDILEVL